jgi:hypothetical protein
MTQNINFKNDAKTLDGVIRIERHYPNGDVELVIEKENLITLPAKLDLLTSLYSPSVIPDPIYQLKVGTGGTVDPEGFYPKAVNSSLTDLFTPLTSVNLSYIINASVPSVTFIADLDQGSGNGYLITEAGLFKTSAKMFNIKTFPGIPKTSEFSLHFEWTIKIA